MDEPNHVGNFCLRSVGWFLRQVYDKLIIITNRISLKRKYFKLDFREVYLLLSIPSCSIDSTNKKPLTVNKHMIRLRHWHCQSFPEDDSAMLNVPSSSAELQLLSCMYNVHVSCLYLKVTKKTSRATSHHPITF
jgi:hypothetical protein